MTLTHSTWPAGTLDVLEPSTVGSTLRASAAAAPSSIALVARRAPGGDWHRWSFDRLLDEAEAAARALLGRFEPGERVAVWAPNVAEFLLVQLAAGLAGLTLVPVPLGLRHRDLAHLLGHAGARGIFLVPEHRGMAMLRLVEELRPRLPLLREVVDLTDWPAFVSSSTGSSSLPSVDTRCTAQIQSTSGSTGLPRGALLHHQGITNSARFLAHRMDLSPGDVWLNFMPLSYVAGSAIGAMAALAATATQVLCDFDPATVLGLVEAERCSAMLGGATMYLRLLERSATTAADLSSVRTLAAGGSVISPELARRTEERFAARMVVVYGLTEASGIAVSTDVGDPEPDRIRTIGTPLPHVEVRVTDPTSGQPLPVNEAGELCLRGYQVMHGYLDSPRATSEAIDSDGWLHTGDLAAMDGGGRLRITGRLKEIINRGGRKIAPGEIEAVLQAHPAVAMAAAVGVPDERWGEEIAAFVTLRAGASADEAQLADWCGTQLAPFKTPRQWVFVDELPLTSAGKVRKFILHERLMHGRAVECGDGSSAGRQA